MAVKRYDGSAWQTVAGLGAQGAAATSSSIATWVKTASGGETSLSGNDDNSQALSYTIGQELVFINGTLLKRGSDYTATNGTSITGLTALAANDVATVWTVNAFSVTGAIANTIVDAKGDLLVGTAADTPGRIAVGTNGQYLKADSTTGTGLTWATLPSSGKVLQVVTATTTANVSTNTTTWTDTGLTASITPSSTSSKVLVLTNQNYQIRRSTNKAEGGYRLRRDTTTIAGDPDASAPDTLAFEITGASFIYVSEVYNFNNLDSPATTSSVTYKTQSALQTTANSAALDNQVLGQVSTIILMEIGA